MNTYTFTILLLLMLLLQDCKNYTVVAFAGSCQQSLIHIKTEARTKLNPGAMLPCATTFLSTLNQEEAYDIKETPCVSLPLQSQHSRPNLVKRALLNLKNKAKKSVENLTTSSCIAEEENTNETTSSISTKGIKLSYLLHQFVRECGGTAALKGLTIRDVYEQFMSTECNKLSYCDHQTSEASTEDAIGDATVLISTSSNHKFLEVLDALAYHFKDEPEKVIWFDAFSLNRHDYMFLEDLEPGWWLNKFSNEVVKKMNHTVMVMPQWDDPTFFAGNPQLFTAIYS